MTDEQLSIHMQDFERFLKKKTKQNGDRLLPASIERYIDWVSKYENKIREVPQDQLIKFMNNEILFYQSGVLHAAFKNYLQFIVAPKAMILELEKTQKRANAQSSVRFLQSKVLSRGELKRVMNEAQELKSRLIVSILYDTACRRHELLTMKYGDLTPSKEGSEDRKKGIYAAISIIGKGKKSRTVYLGKTSWNLIQEMNSIEQYKSDSLIVKMTGDDGEMYQYPDNELYKLIVTIGDKILERHIHPHCFRHTKLTHLADEGADILDISSYAGHSNTAVTEIYLHISSFRGKRAFTEFSKDILA